MSQPPRAVESILKGLGADPYLTDVILGDLAEEFDERAAFDGEAQARRWYTSEAIRSVPHLLRSAFGRLRTRRHSTTDWQRVVLVARAPSVLADGLGDRGDGVSAVRNRLVD